MTIIQRIRQYIWPERRSEYESAWYSGDPLPERFGAAGIRVNADNAVQLTAVFRVCEKY